MDLYKEILVNAIAKGEVKVRIVGNRLNPDKVVEQSCYKALRAIRAVLDNETLDDPSCFRRIEEIVCLFEELGSNGGCRHDF